MGWVGIYSNGRIDSNIITNIRINSSNTYGSFVGILNSPGTTALYANNVIGSMTDTAAIVVYGGSIIGIGATGSMSFSSTNIQNNKIGGLTAYASSVNPLLYGIQISDMDTATLKNNIVGGNIVGSIKFIGTTGEVRGISLTRTKDDAKILCDSNGVRELIVNFGGTGNFLVSGIYNSSQLGDVSRRWIRANTISD
jgi:hypothetical protein